MSANTDVGNSGLSENTVKGFPKCEFIGVILLITIV